MKPEVAVHAALTIDNWSQGLQVSESMDFTSKMQQTCDIQKVDSREILLKRSEKHDFAIEDHPSRGFEDKQRPKTI